MADREHLIVTKLTVEDIEAENFRLTNTSWDDLRREASASNIDSASTRYAFDYDEGVITFDNDARIANERIIYTFQLPHAWKEGSDLEPHLHWWMDQANTPNWWMKWRKWNNGAVRPVSWTEAIHASNVFTYSSGEICQITRFPTIDLSDITISGFVQVTFGRDTGNVSTLFTGADPVATGVDFIEFDMHAEYDSFGSNDEFIKGS